MRASVSCQQYHPECRIEKEPIMRESVKPSVPFIPIRSQKSEWGVQLDF